MSRMVLRSSKTIIDLENGKDIEIEIEDDYLYQIVSIVSMKTDEEHRVKFKVKLINVKTRKVYTCELSNDTLKKKCPVLLCNYYEQLVL